MSASGAMRSIDARASRAILTGVLLLLLVSAGCGGGDSSTTGEGGSSSPGGSDGGAALPAITLAPTAPGLAGVTVGTPALIDRRRVTRTVFEYTYAIAITNGGSQRWIDVVGTVRSATPTTAVIDGDVAFGEVAAGAVASSVDTFSIRQDRLVPVAAADLRISLSGRIPSVEPAVGVLLEGSSDALALTAIVDVPPLAAESTDIVDDFLLTRLDWVVARDATVGEINGALAAIGGGIVGMRSGRPALVVAVPRQADATALGALATASRGLPGVALAFPGRQGGVSVAPPSPANGEDYIGYLRDAGFPAAWNARGAIGDCAGERVPVIVADFYHRPKDSLYNDFSAQLPGVVEAGVGSVDAENLRGYHGYDVWTTLAAGLDETPPNGAFPFPECLRPIALQLAGQSAHGQLFALEWALPSDGHVVVNHSVSFATCADCDRSLGATIPPLERGAIGAFARVFLDAVRERMLLVQASGNYANERVAEIYPGFARADFISSYAIAARSDSTMSWVEDASLWRPDPGVCGEEGCLPSLVPSVEDAFVLRDQLDGLGFGAIPMSENVAIVGSATRDLTNGPSEFSNEPADVRAVGENVPTLLGVPAFGTSFAAPQFAALAGYLWLLSPELRAAPVADTIASIRANASATGMISAYAAVLSVDSGRPLSPSASPVRLAILDVDGNGSFDQADLSAYLGALRPGGLDADPSDRDDSRYDLNGDGFTGGMGAAAHDLDPIDSPRFGRRNLTLVTTEVLGDLTTYDERGVTDVAALCFYAHSPLYTGDLAVRNELLFDVCAAGEETWVGSWTRRYQYDSNAGASLQASTQISQLSSVSVRAVRIDGEYVVQGTASVTTSRTSVFRLSTTGTLTCTETDRYSGGGPANGFDADSGRAVLGGDTDGTRTQTSTCVRPPLSSVTATSLGVTSNPPLEPVEFDENDEVSAYGVSVSEPLSGPYGTGGSFSQLLTIEGRVVRLR